MQEVRELILQPDRNYRRVKNKIMDTRLKHLVQNVPLENDQSIRVFLQSVSLALQGMEEDLIMAEENEENINEVDENESNKENSDATGELVRDIKVPLIRSGITTIDVPSSSNAFSSYNDHNYDY